MMHPGNKAFRYSPSRTVRPPLQAQPQQLATALLPQPQQLAPELPPQPQLLAPAFPPQPQQFGPALPLPYPMQQQNMMMPQSYPFQHPQYVDPTLYSPAHKAYVQIRQVSNLNFMQEMENIRYLINETPFKVVSMDTEFPGVVFESNNVMDHRNPEAQYSLMKRNVDQLNLIQVGLTLSDKEGNLPTFGSGLFVVWEFALSDFDIYQHQHNARSIDMLRSRGLDFDFHRTQGINSHVLMQAMLTTGMLSSTKEIHWVTFHGSYDFGYLIKAITRNALPEKLEDFKILVEQYFGKHVYDIKYMLGFYPHLFGGLEAIAAKVGIHRVIGLGHQAGSDSLLTQMVFQKIKTDYFIDEEQFQKIPGHIFPLA